MWQAWRFVVGQMNSLQRRAMSPSAGTIVAAWVTPAVCTHLAPKARPLTGLVPFIHVLKRPKRGKEDVGTRHKAGYGVFLVARERLSAADFA
jgi:hypothetical protein